MRAQAPEAAAAPIAAGPKLYVLDCGTISPMDPALFSLKKEEVKGDVSFASPCFLIVHPKGTLAWDVGQVPDAKIKEDGTEAVEQDILKATRRLSTQLAALGHPIDGITYVAMSHYHADHTANANAFAKSTWIVQQAEYDMMFKEGQIGIRTPESYKDLRDAKRITLNNADHDVFGDGTVVVKTAPGHTPGHQMLFLQAGPLRAAAAGGRPLPPARGAHAGSRADLRFRRGDDPRHAREGGAVPEGQRRADVDPARPAHLCGPEEGAGVLRLKTRAGGLLREMPTSGG